MQLFPQTSSQNNHHHHLNNLTGLDIALYLCFNDSFKIKNTLYNEHKTDFRNMQVNKPIIYSGKGIYNEIIC